MLTIILPDANAAGAESGTVDLQIQQTGFLTELHVPDP